MKFNDTSGKSGILQDCETLLGFEDGDITGNSTRLKEFTRLVNVWYQRAANWIWEAENAWEFDDSNKTDLPIATTTLVTTAGSEQQDYEMPSSALTVNRVEVMDKDGDYKLLRPFDQTEQRDRAMSEFLETPGFPRFYDLLGRSIFLYPKPLAADVTESEGLKLWFDRDVTKFESTDTTTEPGFAANFHRILSLGACRDYSLGKEMYSRLNAIKPQLEELKKSIQKYYNRRDQSSHTRIIPKKQSFI